MRCAISGAFEGHTTVRTQDPLDLNRIVSDAVHSVHLTRTLPPAIGAYAQRLTKTPWSLDLMAEKSPLTWRLPAGAGRAGLLADIRWALARFAKLAGVSKFRAKLDSEHTDKCHRFHIDYYRLRWIMTFAGPGTEYLNDNDVDPRAMNLSTAAGLSVSRPGACVQHATLGDVLVMKGKGYQPEVAYGGLVHRSPPVEATAKRRLLLTLTSG